MHSPSSHHYNNTKYQDNIQYNLLFWSTRIKLSGSFNIRLKICTFLFPQEVPLAAVCRTQSLPLFGSRQYMAVQIDPTFPNSLPFKIEWYQISLKSNRMCMIHSYRSHVVTLWWSSELNWIRLNKHDIPIDLKWLTKLQCTRSIT